jgi:hypothetical protein
MSKSIKLVSRALVAVDPAGLVQWDTVSQSREEVKRAIARRLPTNASDEGWTIVYCSVDDQVQGLEDLEHFEGCPVCEGEAFLNTDQTSSGTIFMECNGDCRMRGPVVSTRRSAVEMWNSLARSAGGGGDRSEG